MGNGGEYIQCGDAGQRDDSHLMQDGAVQYEMSSCDSEWYPIKKLGILNSGIFHLIFANHG